MLEYDKYYPLIADRMERGVTTEKLRNFLKNKGLKEEDIFLIICGAEIFYKYR